MPARPDDYASQLKRLRLTQRLSLQRLGERVGVSRSYLSSVERGRDVPRPELIIALARELGADPDHLLAAAGRLPPEMVAGLLAAPHLWTDVRRLLAR